MNSLYQSFELTTM